MSLSYDIGQQRTGLKPVCQVIGAALALSSSVQNIPFTTVLVDSVSRYASPVYTTLWSGLYRVTIVIHPTVVAASAGACGFNLQLVVNGANTATSSVQIDSLAGHGYTFPMMIDVILSISSPITIGATISVTNTTSGNLGTGSQSMSIEYIEKA